MKDWDSWNKANPVTYKWAIELMRQVPNPLALGDRTAVKAIGCLFKLLSSDDSDSAEAIAETKAFLEVIHRDN